MSNVMHEKTVMCFGDSNTWGCDPSGGARFDRSTRWPGVLQEVLGKGYHVIEEGLGGRTTVWDDPIEGSKNGSKHLGPLLQSHGPLDLLIIMLGTNDLKNRFSVSAFDVALSVERLVVEAGHFAESFVKGVSEVLVICPPPFAPMAEVPLRDMFVGGEEKSHQLAAAFRQRCEEKDICLIDAGEVIESSPLDGIHLAASEHQKLAQAVALEVRKLI